MQKFYQTKCSGKKHVTSTFDLWPWNSVGCQDTCSCKISSS